MNHTTYLIQLGKTLYHLRTNQGLSQEHLGELAGLDRTYISKIENGNNLTIESLIRVSHALNTSPCKILKITEDSLNASK